jgi:hypothetical protein
MSNKQNQNLAILVGVALGVLFVFWWMNRS